MKKSTAIALALALAGCVGEEFEPDIFGTGGAAGQAGSGGSQAGSAGSAGAGVDSGPEEDAPALPDAAPPDAVPPDAVPPDPCDSCEDTKQGDFCPYAATPCTGGDTCTKCPPECAPAGCSARGPWEGGVNLWCCP